MFEPGDQVECVNAGPIQAPGRFKGHASGLTLGAIYTVKEFHPKGVIPGLQADGLEVNEVAHPDPRMVFPVMRFRLLKRHDPELVKLLLSEPAPLEPVDD
jgi:hypothetical protein